MAALVTAPDGPDAPSQRRPTQHRPDDPPDDPRDDPGDGHAQVLDDVDAALAEALATPLPDEGPGGLLTLEELAAASDTPLVVLEALARERLLLPRDPGDPEAGEPPRWAMDDAAVVDAGMALLSAGLPLAELLELARRADEALRPLADHAVETFLRYVRDPVRGTTDDDGAAADELVAAFRSMLPATGTLVGGHFRRLVVASARERIQRSPAPDVPPDDTPDDPRDDARDDARDDTQDRVEGGAP